MSPEIKTVDEYISQFPAEVQERMESIRKTIKTLVPKAAELISYGMPAYKYNGPLVYFGGFKNHIGFYAVPSGHEAFARELSKYKGGKGSVQFPHKEDLPLDLISKIVQFRKTENEQKNSIK